MKSKHSKKSNKKLTKIILLLLIVIFICGISYICFYFCSSNKNKKDNTDVLNKIDIDNTQVTEEKTEKMLKLEELQKENTDIIGWLQIDGTNIDYPVLQTTDNSYYLSHNYKKEYSKSGSLFLDKDFELEKPSTNHLIYGHRNTNGLMFEDLINYKKEDYYKQHPIINFTTLTEDCQYEIIAVFLSRVYYKSETNVFRYYYFINAENEKEYNNYITNCKNASLYETGKSANYGDQLLTLSTCEYSQEDGRLAAVARKIEK